MIQPSRKAKTFGKAGSVRCQCNTRLLARPTEFVHVTDILAVGGKTLMAAGLLLHLTGPIAPILRWCLLNIFMYRIFRTSLIPHGFLVSPTYLGFRCCCRDLKIQV